MAYQLLGTYYFLVALQCGLREVSFPTVVLQSLVIAWVPCLEYDADFACAADFVAEFAMHHKRSH